MFTTSGIATNVAPIGAGVYWAGEDGVDEPAGLARVNFEGNLGTYGRDVATGVTAIAVNAQTKGVMGEERFSCSSIQVGFSLMTMSQRTPRMEVEVLHSREHS